MQRKNVEGQLLKETHQPNRTLYTWKNKFKRCTVPTMHKPSTMKKISQTYP